MAYLRLYELPGKALYTTSREEGAVSLSSNHVLVRPELAKARFPTGSNLICSAPALLTLWRCNRLQPSLSRALSKARARSIPWPPRACRR